jgi:centromere/kinetochore protein ZW10
VKALSRGSAPDVDTWIQNANSLQTDIDKSRALAAEIVRADGIGEQRLAEVEDAENHVRFLLKERSYNSQVEAALRAIKNAWNLLDEVEATGSENRILDALHLLASKRNQLLLDLSRRGSISIQS